MMTFAEVQKLIPDVKLSREAAQYGDEIIVHEIVPENEMNLGGGQMYLINTVSKKMKMIPNTILSWPDWYLNDKETEIKLL